jgi:hypothetical protein
VAATVAVSREQAETAARIRLGVDAFARSFLDELARYRERGEDPFSDLTPSQKLAKLGPAARALQHAQQVKRLARGLIRRFRPPTSLRPRYFCRMAERNDDLIRGVYGFSWAAVADRGRGLAAAGKVMAPEAQARVSPEVGDRTLNGLEGFAVFVEGLEGGLSEFRYQAEKFDEITRDRSWSPDIARRAGVKATCRSRLLSATSGHCATRGPSESRRAFDHKGRS